MLTGRPADLPSEEGAHLANIKGDIAREKGAVGIITLHTPEREKVRKFETSVYYTKTPRMTWIGPNGLPQGEEQQLMGSAYVNIDAAKAMFEGAEKPLEDIFKQIEEDPNASPKVLRLTAQFLWRRSTTKKPPALTWQLSYRDRSEAERRVCGCTHTLTISALLKT